MTDRLRTVFPDLGRFFRGIEEPRLAIKVGELLNYARNYKHSDLAKLEGVGTANILPVLADGTNEALANLGVKTEKVEEIEGWVLGIANELGYKKPTKG